MKLQPSKGPVPGGTVTPLHLRSTVRPSCVAWSRCRAQTLRRMPDCAPARRRSRSLARTSSLEPLGAMPYPPPHPFSLCPFSRCDVRISSPAVLDPPPELGTSNPKPRSHDPSAGAVPGANSATKIPCRSVCCHSSPTRAPRPTPRKYGVVSLLPLATYIAGHLHRAGHLHLRNAHHVCEP